jgi:hypothetical protein
MTPTPEQLHIIELARQGGSLKVNAFAGTGKTTTLGLLADAHPAKKVLYLAFNKDIATDAGDKMGPKVLSQTMHSAAYRAMKPNRDRLNARMSGSWVAQKFGLTEIRIAGKSITTALQGAMVLTTLIRFCNSVDLEPPAHHVPGMAAVFDHIPKELLSARREWAEVTSRVSTAALSLWAEQIDPRGSVPITHDTYLKMWALSEPQIKTDLIMFDEAQDASPVFIGLLNKQQAPVVWVGDRHQQIYGWRGAVDALANVSVNHEGHLTKSFRFGENVASVANALLSHLGERMPLIGAGGDSKSQTMATLCRTNAGAIGHFMAAGGDVELAGAQQLGHTLRDLESLIDGNPRGAFALFDSYGDLLEHAENGAGQELRPIVKAIENYGIQQIRDKVDRSQRQRGGHLHTISTCHKAKGREWGSVHITDDWPTEKSGDPKLSEDEARLLYVAVTRAQRDLDTSAIAPWLKLVGHNAADADTPASANAVQPEIITTATPAQRPKIQGYNKFRDGPYSEFQKQAEENPEPVVKSPQDTRKPKKPVSTNADRQARFSESQRAMGRRSRKLWATDSEAEKVRAYLEKLRGGAHEP